ncbi:DUF6250 domain-containing protein [Sphingobium sp. CR2-8]|nr:DUF6250 domain-containing protein [Sphingobium sp. CR2-8]MEC3911862.1 DUF6250 domain-containing protein [Sphingobium sp. CR2-8]
MAIFVLTSCWSSVAAAVKGLLWRDTFRHGLDQWRVEAVGDASVSASEGVLDIVAPKGVTLWFRERLTGPLAIHYDVRAVGARGPFDTVSDVNAFWMAGDPATPSRSVFDHPRTGTFEDYDGLETYYVGIGGNRNSTTRMRRYVGKFGERPLLPQHDRTDADAMLTADRWFSIALIADGHHIAVLRDGVPLFTLNDPHPYRSGHFGLRTTQSHIQVRNFSISRL